MNKLTHYWNSFLKFTDRNTPHILTAASIIGLVETGILSFKAGGKTLNVMINYDMDVKDLERKGSSEGRTDLQEIEKDTAKKIIPILVPPVLMGATTAACIIGSDKISAKRIATLSAAYTIADTALKEYKDKVEEIAGEKKARAIQESITKDRVNKSQPPEDISQLPTVGNGRVLCKDTYSGRFFYSDANRIKQTILKLSSDCVTDMWIPLNDLYYELGLEQVPMGNDLGWNADDLIQYQLPISITAVLTEDQQPCLGLDYDVHLRADFRGLL